MNKNIRAVIGGLVSIFMALLFQQSAAADTLNRPPWPNVYDGNLIDASGVGILPPYCWTRLYATPSQPAGAGIYTSAEISVLFVPFVDCFSQRAVLFWPDPRIPVPQRWATLPRVGRQAFNLHCEPATAKELAGGPAAQTGPVYTCVLYTPGT